MGLAGWGRLLLRTYGADICSIQVVWSGQSYGPQKGHFVTQSTTGRTWAYHKSSLCGNLEGVLLCLQDLSVDILPLLHQGGQLQTTQRTVRLYST